ELGPEGFTAEIGFTRFRTPQVRKSDKSDLRGQARGGESCRAGRRVRPLSVRLLVLPVADEVVDHGRVAERRGVAEIAVLVFGDLAQNSAHDLSRARLRQAGRELNEIGRGDRADLLAHPGDQLLAQLFAWAFAGHQRDVGVDALALDVVRV